MLEEGEAIEFRPVNRRLVIRSTKAKAGLILDELDRVIGRIRTQEFPVESVSPSVPDEATLAELSRVTNTYVSVTRSKKEVSVP